MVHEVATKVITVPMCLRLKGTKGFTFCTFSFQRAYKMAPQDSLLLMLISVIGSNDWQMVTQAGKPRSLRGYTISWILF
jgi:hypothetical protein